MQQRVRILQRKTSGSTSASRMRAPSSFEADQRISRTPLALGHRFQKLSVQQRQAKLTVNDPGDSFEREADAVSSQVLRMDAPDNDDDTAVAGASPEAGSAQRVAREEATEEETPEPVDEQKDPEAQRVMREEATEEETDKPTEAEKEPEAQRVMRKEKPEGSEDEEEPKAEADQDDPNVQRKCAECAQEDEEKVSRVESGDVSPDEDVSGAVNGGLLSGGQALDAETRGFMEPRFGHDFSQVRIHTDSKASDSTEAVSARAYTVGTDIAFRSGEYNPGSSQGKQLLAHELTHVVQQGGAGVRRMVQRDVESDMGPDSGGADDGVGQVVSLPDQSFDMEQAGDKVFGKSVHLEGSTVPNFKASAKLLNRKATTSKDCAGCVPPECVHVTGTLQFSYSVATSVTLPKVSDFPDLTPCEKKKVQDAINNILAPHEQQHVKAFKTYDGSTKQSFDQTLCKSEVSGAISSLFTAEQSARQAQAQAASDALDPFNFDFDLNCEDAKADAGADQSEDGPSSAVAASESGPASGPELDV